MQAIPASQGRGSRHLPREVRPLSVFMDARLAVRGLGISSAASRLVAALDANSDTHLHLNASSRGWNRRGKVQTALLSGTLDISPRADPRTWPYDVVHYYGNTAPQVAGRSTVITVHDLMCLRGSARKSQLYRALLLPGLRRARTRHIVAISAQTADDLIDLLPEVRGRVLVIPHGYRAGRFSAEPRQHILMFGGHSDARKRIEVGLGAYERYAQKAGRAALPLVIAGRAGIDRQIVDSQVCVGRVEVHADPSTAHVERLLARAACLIYPSAEEGFGLPIVEAGEVGTPVVYDRLARIPTEPLGLHAKGVAGPDISEWAASVQAAVESGPVPEALTHLRTWGETARDYIELYRVARGSR